MILTNKMKVDIFIDNIIEDFDLCVINRKSKHIERTNILDISTQEFKAVATQYKFGKEALVLFKKGAVKESVLRERLSMEHKDVTVSFVTDSDLRDADFCRKIFYYQNRLLVQLLLNSLMNYSSDLLSYNNLTGKLFYTNSDWVVKDKKTEKIAFISFLEVMLDPGMYLNLNVKTFKRDKYAKTGRQYIFDDMTGRLRKRLKTDDLNVDIYTEGSFKSKHKTIDYLDISSFEKFQKTKLGVMNRFFEDVERKLGRYLSMKPSETENADTYLISKKEKQGLSNCDIGEILKKRGIVIVDENKTEKSQEIIKILQDELYKYYGVETSVGEIDNQKYNIRIIHSPEYYEEMGINDPYSVDLTGYIVQHLIEEVEHFNDKESVSPAVNKIVQELIIKGDVRDKVISIYDWNRLDSDKEWTFVIRDKIKTAFEEEKESHVNAAGEKEFNYYNYKVLKIFKDGILEFSSFNDQDDIHSTFYESICFAFDSFQARYKGGLNTVEGLVFSDINNIHAIILTPEKTLPNISALAVGLKMTDKSSKVESMRLAEGIDSFIEYADLTEEEILSLENIKETILREGHSLSLQEVRKILGMGKKLSKQYNRFMHENYNIWISAEIKDQDFNDVYRLDNILDIKYYEQLDYDNIPSFYYYVGTKRASLQGSIHNACVIRKVVSEQGNIEFKELLPLMAVDFVRNKQYTVLPFPFKYLREWKC